MSRAFNITLPIADRQRSHTFYQAGLGLEPVGELAPDGLPEPLQFRLFGEACLSLITAGGTVLTPPTHQPWGFESLVADPDGHAWQLYVG